MDRRARQAMVHTVAKSQTRLKWLGMRALMNPCLISKSIILPQLCMCMLSHFRLFVTLWTIAHQSPLSMEFSRQEYWSGLPYSPPGDLPDPGIEPASLKSPALVSVFFTTWRRKWQPTPIFLPGEFHGQRSLVGCSPWGGKELDMTEQLILSLPLPPPENPTLNHPTSLNQVLISAWMLDMSTST